MSPETKDPYKFSDPLAQKQLSVAGRRHARHTTTHHPHTILGALAPDAAPSKQQIPDVITPAPPAPHPKPVSDILPTALPPEESYNEAALVANSAFQSHYTVPQATVNPILYGSSTNGLAGDAGSVVPEEDYNMSMDGGHGRNGSSHTGHGSGVSVTKVVIIVMGMLIVLLAISLVAVIVATKK